MIRASHREPTLQSSWGGDRSQLELETGSMRRGSVEIGRRKNNKILDICIDIERVRNILATAIIVTWVSMQDGNSEIASIISGGLESQIHDSELPLFVDEPSRIHLYVLLQAQAKADVSSSKTIHLING